MRKHIVIVSPAYGGAEKRFFDIYTALRREGEGIFYVAPSMLVGKLKADHPERSDVFDQLVTIQMDKWSAAGFIWQYRKLLRSLPSPSAFHYPMNCLWPLHISRKDVLSLSIVDCTTTPRITVRERNSALNYIALFFVRNIDILSPSVFEEIQKYSISRKATLTPGGSFLLPPVTIETTKDPTVTFFGRFIEDKGILDFLRVAPELWQSLRGRVPDGFRLKVAGYGPLEADVAAAINALQARNVPIDFEGYKSAEDAMRRSAIVLSLQQTTNYPSRVVAEALTSGCAVIVRASGDSTAFGNDLPGLAYCSDKLEVDQLAHIIAALVEQTYHNQAFCREIHTQALRRFYSSDYLDYFNGVVFSGDPLLAP